MRCKCNDIYHLEQCNMPHNNELDGICQGCFLHCEHEGVICRHLRVKKEVSQAEYEFDPDITKYYCLICKKYIDESQVSPESLDETDITIYTINTLTKPCGCRFRFFFDHFSDEPEIEFFEFTRRCDRHKFETQREIMEKHIGS